MAYTRRRSRQQSLGTALVLLAILVCICYAVVRGRHEPAPPPAFHSRSGSYIEASDHVSCGSLPPLARDLAVVIKSTALSLPSTLPAQLASPLACFPRLLLFSDWPETFSDNPVLDALASVDIPHREQHPDFHLWRSLHSSGPETLSISPEANATLLDKWKVLPILIETLHRHPKAKWFLFLEDSTFISLPGLWESVRRLDFRRALYVGKPEAGAGVLLSQSALRRVVAMYVRDRHSWDQRTDYYVLGAELLTRALHEAGVDRSEETGFFSVHTDLLQRNTSCDPIVGVGNLEPETITELYSFLEQVRDQPNHVLLPSSLVRDFLLPRLSSQRTDWDNLSSDSESPSETAEACRALCNRDEKCVQWSFTLHRASCRLSSSFHWGGKDENVLSGWMAERVRELVEVAKCTDRKRV